MLVAVIMAGGKGERFWPKSRECLPKQFLSLLGDETMAQQTVNRIAKLIPYDQIFVVTGEGYRELAYQQLPMLPRENIICEPVGRNTAPCIGLAALYVQRKFPRSTMIVLPSDHVIQDEAGFLACVETGLAFLEGRDGIVTFGIKPKYPETGYGYIEFTNEQAEDGVYTAKRFVEKPDLDLANEYLASGRYLWNSGMFMFDTKYILDRISLHLPELAGRLGVIGEAISTEKEDTVLGREFALCPKISIDYGVMEREEKIFVIPGDFGWDDVGSWTATEKYLDLIDGNRIKGDCLLSGAKGNIVHNDGETMVALLGVEDLIVVVQQDAILIAKKEEAQNVRSIVERLKENGRTGLL